MIERLKFRGKCTKRFQIQTEHGLFLSTIECGQFVTTDDFIGAENSVLDSIADRIVKFFEHVAVYLIDPATVGQWTGLKDSKGVDVYEGDLLVQIENGENIGDFEVEWERTYGFYCKSIGDDGDPEYNAEMINIEACAVIGNIHDKESDQ